MSQPTKISSNKLNMMIDMSTFTNLMIGSANEEGVVYGSVNAPSWALPVGAFVVILTAALPAFLAGGEKALEQQRIDEQSKGNEFGSGDSVNKRKDSV